MATTVTTPIKIAYPTVDGDLELRIEAGACRLRVTPGESDAWVAGTYQDPSGSIEITTVVEGNRGRIQVGRSPADVFGFFSGIPELTLELGKTRRFSLSIAAGASENQLELGGLPITRLEINHGAGSMDITFSSPLSTPTTLLKFGVGAGKTNVSGLGFVNFEDLSVEGGAASCMLDFSGSGLQSGSVRLSTAMASVELRIPQGLSAEITSENVLGHPQGDGGFSRRGNTWLNQAALQKPAQLRVRSTMVMGSLRLTTVD